MSVSTLSRALGLGTLILALPLPPAHAATAHLPAIRVDGADADDPRVSEVDTATRTRTPAREVPQA
ncbi:hypothetical protein AD428_19725, partial [Achromobacter sp. DMS1]